MGLRKIRESEGESRQATPREIKVCVDCMDSTDMFTVCMIKQDDLHLQLFQTSNHINISFFLFHIRPTLHSVKHIYQVKMPEAEARKCVGNVFF